MNAKSISVHVGGGGFHNACSVQFDLPPERVFSTERIDREFANPHEHFAEEALLSGSELQRVADQMCGIRECSCESSVSAILFQPADCARFGVETADDLFLCPVEIK